MDPLRSLIGSVKRLTRIERERFADAEFHRDYQRLRRLRLEVCYRVYTMLKAEARRSVMYEMRSMVLPGWKTPQRVTFEEIGTISNFTRERVRQLVVQRREDLFREDRLQPVATMLVAYARVVAEWAREK